jgi:NAD(P)-dependent dehydrogenase (short-subunit alcohol dehydrogenase family)
MDLGVAGRVAIVTGSSRGIGRACAESLLREGATVVITGRDEERLQSAHRELADRGKILAVRVDFASDTEVRELAKRTLDAFGRLDILINSAASVSPADFFS